MSDVTWPGGRKPPPAPGRSGVFLWKRFFPPLVHLASFLSLLPNTFRTSNSLSLSSLPQARGNQAIADGLIRRVNPYLTQPGPEESQTLRVGPRGWSENPGVNIALVGKSSALL